LFSRNGRIEGVATVFRGEQKKTAAIGFILSVLLLGRAAI